MLIRLSIPPPLSVTHIGITRQANKYEIQVQHDELIYFLRQAEKRRGRSKIGRKDVEAEDGNYIVALWITTHETIETIILVNYQNSISLGTNNVSFLYFISFFLQPSICHWNYTSKRWHDTKTVLFQLKTKTPTQLEILNLEHTTTFQISCWSIIGENWKERLGPI